MQARAGCLCLFDPFVFFWPILRTPDAVLKRATPRRDAEVKKMRGEDGLNFVDKPLFRTPLFDASWRGHVNIVRR